MKKNIGTIDTGLRLAIAIFLFAYAIPLDFPTTGWNWVGWFGVIPLATIVIGNCPLYSLLGLNTCTNKINIHEGDNT